MNLKTRLSFHKTEGIMIFLNFLVTEVHLHLIPQMVTFLYCFSIPKLLLGVYETETTSAKLLLFSNIHNSTFLYDQNGYHIIALNR